MSKGKVKVRDICLNISFLTWFFSSFHSYIKKSAKSFLKKTSLDISLQHKNKANYKCSKKKKKKLLHLANFRAGADRVKEGHHAYLSPSYEANGEKT